MEKLDFTKTYVLENDRVRLQPLKETDYVELVRFSHSEPTLWQYSLMQANSESKMKNYITAALDHKSKGMSYPFVVFDKRYKQIVGSTRFYDFSQLHSTTQLGYTWYGKDFQGTGLNKNCKFLMLQFAFEQLGLERVEFRADNNNARSIAAMKSIGCTVEGVLRNNCASETGRRDSIILSILKDEWYDGIKHMLIEKISSENLRKL